MMIDQFKQGFQEEARELLIELEAALLELDQNREDLEIVGRAFRALHTIKGSGAMFGFDNIAGFVHDLETVFDQIRNGQLAATSDLVNLSLVAGDQIKSMLDEAAGMGTSDQSRAATILSDLRKLASAAKPAAEPSSTPPAAPPSLDEGPRQNGCWAIHFRPGPDVLANGTNPLLLFRELRELGTLQVLLDPTAIPGIDQIEPERCYVAWNLVLSTPATRDAIRDVFIFIEDDSELTIELQPTSSIEPVGEEEKSDFPHRIEPDAGSKIETLDNKSAKAAAVASTLRVSADKLDQLVNLVGELVTVQAHLSELAARQENPEILAISEEVDRLTAELRENSMSMRLLTLRSTFERFRRLVHDLSAELGKDVELALEGAETELDKTLIDQLKDPLVHLIRNSMDHGIESPAERVAAGKPPTATIRISALHAGAHVLIRVSDDGRGLNAEAVRARAIEKGLISAAAELSEAEMVSLILMPGFSTAEKITDVSGRGVGMDVIRRSVENLRGSIEINSAKGAGVSVTLRLPLTLAIIDGLLVRVGLEHFILPLANSLECVELTRQDIREVHGNRLASVRGKMIPYIRLSEHFEMQVQTPEREQIMVVETEDGLFGLVVDEVLGNHQTVIKNLGKLYRDVQMVSGATILGNGTVALIIDPHRLVQNALQTCSRQKYSDRPKPKARIFSAGKSLTGEQPGQRNQST